jgi:hypothetical protein
VCTVDRTVTRKGNKVIAHLNFVPGKTWLVMPDHWIVKQMSHVFKEDGTQMTLLGVMKVKFNYENVTIIRVSKFHKVEIGEILYTSKR